MICMPQILEEEATCLQIIENLILQDERHPALWEQFPPPIHPRT